MDNFTPHINLETKQLKFFFLLHEEPGRGVVLHSPSITPFPHPHSPLISSLHTFVRKIPFKHHRPEIIKYILNWQVAQTSSKEREQVVKYFHLNHNIEQERASRRE